MIFIIDFDGTITINDIIDELLKKFADPKYEEIEKQWQNNQITEKECLSRQFQLINAETNSILEYLNHIAIDPYFEEFCHTVQSFAKLIIASSGIDYPIKQVLNRLKLNIPFYSHQLIYSKKPIKIKFRNEVTDCPQHNDVCKCAILDSHLSDTPIILIGDGKSDYCAAHKADFVFAKKSLATYCKQNQIPYYEFKTFKDILEFLGSNADKLITDFFHKT